MADLGPDTGHVSFKLLLKSHNGDHGKALNAWRMICSLGGYGDVSPDYEGGLDLSPITIAQAREAQAKKYGISEAEVVSRGLALGENEIRIIQDLSAGDTSAGETSKTKTK